MADTVNTLYLNFTTENGNSETISIKYAASSIIEDETADEALDNITAAAKWFLVNQPLEATLATFDSAEFEEETTTVLTEDTITAEDAASESTSD